MSDSPRTESDDGRGVYAIRAVARVCDLLDTLQRHPEGVTLAAITEQVDLPKSSAFRYLASLEARGYAVRDDSGQLYLPGPAFLASASKRLDLIVSRVHEHLVALRDEFDETMNLGLLDGAGVVYLDIVETPRTVRLAARLGDRDPLHSTALGKALASLLDEDEVRALLADESLPARTPRTLTEVDGYLAELRRVRTRGHSLDDGENESDGRCVGVPIQHGPERIAISMSAPAARFPKRDVERVAERLRDAAAAIAADLRASAL